jgi:hypothetical protein
LYLAHRGVLGRADIPDIGPPSILALLAYRSLRPHGAVESLIYALRRNSPESSSQSNDSA